jgi:hypothetical protein
MFPIRVAAAEVERVFEECYHSPLVQAMAALDAHGRQSDGQKPKPAPAPAEGHCA